MYSDSWRKHFRYETFRKGQEEAIVAIAKNLDDGKKFVIAELPTGIGKSDIAMALAKSTCDEEKAFIVTSQNILIDQYVNDFGHMHWKSFHHVKGRTHYTCKSLMMAARLSKQKFNIEIDKKQVHCKAGSDSSCPESKQTTTYEEGSKEEPTPIPADELPCPYKRERNMTIVSKIALLNTTYYALAVKQDPWSPRSLVVIDEAHNLADEIMNLTEISFDGRKLQNLLSMEIPAMPPASKVLPESVDVEAFTRWVKEVLDLSQALLHRASNSPAGLFSALDIEMASDLVGRITRYLKSINEGVDWIVDKEIIKLKFGSYTKLIARPLSTAPFAQSLLFEQGDQFLLQSATIVDMKRYAADLSLTGQGVGIRKPSPFAVENRLVYSMNTAKMSYKEIDGNLPLIAKEIERILLKRPDRKGIIHTASYKIQKYLETNLKNDRLIFPKAGEREKAIEDHLTSDKPTVLVSPSMTEGFDGKGDIVRFQIICKLPYPSLADRRIKILADRDQGWYNYQTLKTVIQSVGRGCRSEDDWCETFVLDAGFTGFINRATVSEDFLKTIRSREEGLKRL